jgi:hypothetical protein
MLGIPVDILILGLELLGGSVTYRTLSRRRISLMYMTAYLTYPFHSYLLLSSINILLDPVLMIMP